MDASAEITQRQASFAPPRPERRKRLRLENKEPATPEIAKLRQQICDHKRKCQEELQEVYRENLSELFFLQHGLNIIDFPVWKKKPNLALSKYLKSYSLDEADDSLEEPTTPLQQKIKSEPLTEVKPESQPKAILTSGQVNVPTRPVLPTEPSSADKPSSSEAIVEQARKEAKVMQRIAELRKNGLWSSKRMPKVQEPPRNKAHWDYLLEEMQWLAADFAQERKWKKAGCRKISRMVLRYWQDKADDEKKAEKEEGFRLKRIAGQLAKQITDFWSNIEKVVQYKHDSRLDEKRRHALDLHLNFIVDQTEKYSSWLSAGLQTGADSRQNSASHSPRSSINQEDGEFQPESGSSDDEETIAKEENAAQDSDGTDAELAALRAESEMPIDELLASLPSAVLEKPASLDSEGESSSNESHPSNADQEFAGSNAESEDDEMTLQEQEEHEDSDHAAELDELKEEGEMSVEELAAKYAGAYASDFEMPDTPSSSEAESNASDLSDLESDEESQPSPQQDDGHESEEVGMEYLLHPEKDEEQILSDSENKHGPGRDITDIAAAAQSLQPTGYTLETTNVKTPIPFLLKHDLREYQHVGLDWLATMYDKQLNGILADEMGLGKTIQTIALLAHLACEHSVWGPHLIVVPTSVMLNWEMELKKWCPGFKILTYYGSQKERKLKRVGWSKTNAFHVCITSYKLVIQDHAAFKRKKWKYLILDEAQNIKNFKSQRWQTLLNFSSQRRLLLTGTPLQNNLMELWSLMHFLMPNVFQSHDEFKEWFSNPLTGMIEGNSEYNEKLIRRLHKVLRPFLLRRLKADVERQLPKKYEHVVMCKLSKRQRLLYEEFMSRRATQDTLAGGNFMSVINILMQLRKVCNHPDMFDPRPIISPFETEPVTSTTAAIVLKALEYSPFKDIELNSLYPSLVDLEYLSKYAAHRSLKLQTPRRLIEAIDNQPEPDARPPPTKLRPFVIRSPTPSQTKTATVPRPILGKPLPGRTVSITSSIMKPVTPLTTTVRPTIVKTAIQPLTVSSGVITGITQSQLTSLVAQSGAQIVRTTSATTTAGGQATSQPLTLQIQQTPQGTRLMIPSTQLPQLQAGLVHIIQTSSGHLITSAANAQALASSGRAVTISSAVTASGVTKVAGSQSACVPTIDPVTGRPVLRVAPLTSSAPAVATAAPQTVASVISAVRTSTNGTTVVAAPKPQPMVRTAAQTISTVATTNKPSLLGPASRKRAFENEAKQRLAAELKLDYLDEKKQQWRQHTLDKIASLNSKHCAPQPLYGYDLHKAVDVWSGGLNTRRKSFSANSALHCYAVQNIGNQNHPRYYWRSTSYLRDVIKTPEERLEELKGVIERFVFLTPPVKSQGVQLYASCHSGLLTPAAVLDALGRRKLADSASLLHPIQTRMLVQFPEKRLIQYDCGKLQTLDLLLRELKSGQHRVLIFTQMTRMLDVLETFLNYHGHRYLRLDGTTKVEMRQALMDRFNADKKIFVFILSTRSGGIGVNLTGADTVIFYDSDWNPTMDAQAQDRCHRIGQTRDVHIYRLISEKTVEENILKKANQKRLLGDVAIEGGNFTTATLQQNTISDLFAAPTGLTSLVEARKSSFASTPVTATSVAPNISERNFEQALGQAEDAEDVAAADVAREEVTAELAEFDENIPWDEREGELRKQQEETSKVEKEIAMLEKELTPVERYALQFLEATDEQFSAEAIREAEEDIEAAKKDWELNRLKQQREEEERRAAMEDDDMLYTYSKEDGMNQAFKDSVTGENMPMWCPPTPPRLESDVYVDQSMCFLYDSAVMPESQLPPLYVKKERKRHREHTNSGIMKKKQRLPEEIIPPSTNTTHSRAPRSLFDRPSAALLKMRREKGLLRHSTTVAASATYQGMKLGQGQQKPGGPSDTHQDQPDFLIHEDWSLLQAVQTLLQLPLNLTILSPAHIPNWDLVSDIVSTTSRIYRSPKQCKHRYESVIIPREEGKILYEMNPRKQQKKTAKSLYKQSKSNKPMRTGQLYSQDSGSSVTTLHAFRFDCIKNVAAKRTPTLRPTLVNPTTKNPKHATVLAENEEHNTFIGEHYGISYDAPKDPEELAKIRHERIRNEKKQAAAEQQQMANQRASNLAARQATTPGTANVQLQHLPVSGATAILNSASKPTASAGVSISRPLPGSIVVNTPGNAAFSTINKRLTSSAAIVSGITNISQTAGATTTIAGQRRMTAQEVQQIQQQQQNRGTPTTMTAVQFVRQSTSASGAPRTITVQQPLGISGTPKSLTTSQITQLNILKQQQARAGGGTLVAQRPGAAGQVRAAGTAVHKTIGAVNTLSGTTVGRQLPVNSPDLLKQKLQVSQRPQLLTGQPVQQTVVTGGTPTLVKPISTSAATIAGSTPVNINVSLAQQKAAAAAIQGTKTTMASAPQFRQIQLLQHHQKGARPLTQKIGLPPHHQLVGTAGKTQASVQIVQQKIGVPSTKIGVQQIQQLIKQQQQQQQAAQAAAAQGQTIQQIITTPSAGTGGQTIIATTQIISAAPNVHATITKMSSPSTNATGLSNVTVSLARPMVSSGSTLALVPGGVSAASLVTQSPSKGTSLTAGTTLPRQPTTVTHRVGGIHGTSQSPTISLASVTLQSQPSVSASLMNKHLTIGSTGLITASQGQTILQSRVTPTSTAASATVSAATPGATGTATAGENPSIPTVLQQATIVTSKAAQQGITMMEVTKRVTTSANTNPSVITPSTPRTTIVNIPITPTITMSSSSAVSSSSSPVQITSGVTDNSATPDSTRTYAMRPRKTNEK